MKILYFIVGLLIAGGMGYIFEPQVRYSLTGIPGDVKIEKPKPTKAAEQNTKEVEKVTIDLSAWAANQLPETVVLTGDVELASEAGDFKAIVKAGTRMNLDEINGPNVKISSSAGGLGGEVPIAQTDLIQQLVDLKKSGNIPAPEAPDDSVAVTETPEASEPEAEQKPFDPFGEGEKPEEPEGEVASTESTTDEPVSTEPEVAENGDDTAPEPEPEETVVEEKPAETVESNANVVAVMQASIKNRDIQEFTAEQVTEWSRETTVETIDGEVYGIGMLSYKAQTVFGEKIIQAKALIQNGKVVRWVWPKSGMNIK